MTEQERDELVMRMAGAYASVQDDGPERDEEGWLAALAAAETEIRADERERWARIADRHAAANRKLLASSHMGSDVALIFEVCAQEAEGFAASLRRGASCSADEPEPPAPPPAAARDGD